MAILCLGNIGTASSDTASTTITVTTTAAIAQGNLVVAGLAVDNSGNNLPTFTTSDVLSACDQIATFDHMETNSIAGTTVHVIAILYRAVSDIPSGSNITFTLSASVTVRTAALVAYYLDGHPSLVGPTTGGTGTATSRSLTTTVANGGTVAILVGGVEDGTLTADAAWNTRATVSIGTGDTGASVIIADRTMAGVNVTYTLGSSISTQGALITYGLNEVASGTATLDTPEVIPAGARGVIGQTWPRGGSK